MKAKVFDIISIMNEIAPPGLAVEKDNTGFQVGRPDQPVEKVWVALDPTKEVVSSACREKVDMLITHHPLIFNPMMKVDFSEHTGSIIHMAAENRLSLFSAHTNLDSAESGVNDILARIIGLKDIKVLGSPLADEVCKLAVFVPEAYEEKMLRVLFETGAGRIGNYSCCSFIAGGTGTFMPEEGSKPFTGKAGELSRVSERRIEIIVLKKDAANVVESMKKAHPYETMAYDIYPVISQEGKKGLGRIGVLHEETNLLNFARDIKEKMNLKTLKVAGRPELGVKKVAVCSGSGSSLMHDFMASGAQVYVSGDLKYHDARTVEEKNSGLIDIGHFESEIIIVDQLAKRLINALEQADLDVKVETCGLEKDPFTVIF
jgi:dinuclear metal center YbgI/SA1388 family protein